MKIIQAQKSELTPETWSCQTNKLNAIKKIANGIEENAIITFPPLHKKKPVSSLLTSPLCLPHALSACDWNGLVTMFAH